MQVDRRSYHLRRAREEADLAGRTASPEAAHAHLALAALHRAESKAWGPAEPAPEKPAR